MIAYHAVFVCVLVVYSPVLLWRIISNPSYRRGLRERTGRVPRSARTRRVVWIHGVSVGEVKAAGTLIRALQREYPELELVLSSTTPTGHAQARKLHPELRVIFYPLDFGGFPARALDRIAPTCVLLMELEIWPNFLRAAARRGVPVAVINGRISARSFRGYRLVRGFLPQLGLIESFCVQDDAYRRRLLDLGVAESSIHVTGNMKYDGVLLKAPPPESERLRSWLAADGRLVLVCGSTHADEEIWLAGIAREVARQLGAPLRLVVAPRHPERGSAIRERWQADGIPSVAWSQIGSGLPHLQDATVVLVDTIGHLESFYGACDLAFVGGSLVPHGGQNMLEPAALGKPVLFGPHITNFLTDVKLLIEADAAIQVRSCEELQREMLRLCRAAADRAEMGRRAVEVIRRNQGATARTLRLLTPLLDRCGVDGTGDIPRPAPVP